MGLIDRFTRDEVSAKVWWPLALFLVVLVVLSFRLENQAVDRRRADAAAWSAAVVRDVLEPSLGSADLSHPLGNGASEDVTVAMQSALAVDGVDAIRLWSAEGTLLYSSVGQDHVGSQEALNDTELQAAVADPSSSVTVIATRSPFTAEPTDPWFLTYVALADSPASVGEVQMTEGVLMDDLSSAWLRTRLLVALAALFTLGLAGLSMREPVARIGTGVKFYPESLPGSMAVIDREEEEMLRQAGVHARRRSEGADHRVEELEASKLALEGELQRALSALAALRAAKGATPRAIPAATSPPVSSVTPSMPQPPEVLGPPVIRVPEAASEPTSVVVDEEPERLRVEEPPARPITLRPVPEPEPEPETRPEAEPLAAEAAEPEREPEPELEPRPVNDEVQAPEDLTPLPDLVVLPEAEPEPAPRPQPVAAAADPDAVDVLQRLVQPVDPERSSADPSDIRARLARTAALKKPGSRERREEQERRSQEDP